MDRKFKKFIVLLAALTPLVLIPYINNPTNLPKLVWIFITSTLLLCYDIRNKLFNARNTFIIPVSLILFWNIVTLNSAVNIYAGLYAILILVLFITFYAALENFVAGDNMQIESLVKIMTVVTVAVSLYGLVQLCGADFLPWELKHSPLSTLGRRNFAAEYLVMIIPFAFYIILSAKEKNDRVLKFLLVPLFLAHLVFTFTRASYMAFFFSSLFFVFAVTGGRKIPSRKTAAFLLAAIIAATPLTSSSKTFETGTVKSRFLIWTVTLKMIRHNPLLGVGPGNFTIQYPHYGIGETNSLRGESINTGNAHNDYLEAAAEGGIPGLIFFLYLLYAAARTFVSLYRKAGKKERLLVSAIAASIVAICVNALASFPFKNAATSLVFWTDLALIGALARRDSRHAQKISGRILWIYLAAFVMTGLTLSYRAIAASRNMFKAKHSMPPHTLRFAGDAVKYNPFSFENAHYAGTEALNEGDYQKAYDYLTQGGKLHPYFDSIYNNLGMVYLFTGHYKESEESFLIALELNPSSAKFNNNMGFLCVNTGRPDTAIEYLRKAISSEPDFYLPYFTLGLAYYVKNDRANAQTYFRKTLQLNPSFAPAKEYLNRLGLSG